MRKNNLPAYEKTIWKHVRQKNSVVPFVIDGEALFSDIEWNIDSTSEREGKKASLRSWNKGLFSILQETNKQPTGDIISKRIYRYSSSYIKITTDLSLAKKLIHNVGIDHLTLADRGWREYRVLSRKNGLIELSSWIPLPQGTQEQRKIASWSIVPLAIVFRNPEGMELEIGTGEDLWRWDNGISKNNKGIFDLVQHGSTLRFFRYVSFSDTAFIPERKTYRFMWYASWRMPQTCRPSLPTTSIVEPIWKKPGTIDVPKTTTLILSKRKPCCLQIDLFAQNAALVDYRMDHNSQNTASSFCFSSRKTKNQLKYFIRQFRSISENTHELSLFLSGGSQGICYNGSHVHRKGKNLHWDFPAWKDFSLWTRKVLGQDTVIYHDLIEPEHPGIFHLF